MDSMLLSKKNKYVKMTILPNANLQIQCDPYQITNGIFQKLKQKISQFIGKHKRPQIAKEVLRKKNGTRGINLPNFRLYYRLHFRLMLQSSRQYGTSTKTEV